MCSVCACLAVCVGRQRSWLLWLGYDSSAVDSASAQNALGSCASLNMDLTLSTRVRFILSTTPGSFWELFYFRWQILSPHPPPPSLYLTLWLFHFPLEPSTSKTSCFIFGGNVQVYKYRHWCPTQWWQAHFATHIRSSNDWVDMLLLLLPCMNMCLTKSN